MPRLPRLVPVLTLPILLTACGSVGSSTAGTTTGDTVSLTHAQGSTAVPASPRKVVVLDYGILDTVDALGLGDVVVGAPTTTLPDFLSRYRDGNVEDVGSVKEPDLEAIAALEPDLIIAGGRTADAYPQLAKIAPTIDLTLQDGPLLSALKTQVDAVATVWGKQTEATTALTRLERAAAATKAKAASSGTGLVVLTTGGKLSAFGPGSRFSLVHDDLGIKPAATGLKQDRHGQVISNEFIAKTNPDRMFVVDRDAAIGQKGASAAQVLDNALVRGTTAAKRGDITYLDGVRWYAVGSGLNTTRAMIAEIDASLSR